MIIDEKSNRSVIGDTEISASASSVRVYAIQSREDIVIARAVRSLL